MKDLIVEIVHENDLWRESRKPSWPVLFQYITTSCLSECYTNTSLKILIRPFLKLITLHKEKNIPLKRCWIVLNWTETLDTYYLLILTSFPRPLFWVVETKQFSEVMSVREHHIHIYLKISKVLVKQGCNHFCNDKRGLFK